MSSAPVFSVVMPLYNKAPYVGAAIRSVLSQRGHDLEVVVVDDGSSDDGAQIVRSLRDGRVRLIQQSNGGVSLARNRGIREARGDFVAFLDADDSYRPGFLDALSTLIARFPDAAVFATGFLRIPGGRDDTPSAAEAGCPAAASRLLHDFYRQWSRGPLFFSSSVCVRRRVFVDDNIFFPVGETLGEDQDVWFRIAERHPVAYCDRALAVYNTGVIGSLTNTAPLTELLPCFVRLSQRLDARSIPPGLRAGARRLLATHLISVARARIAAGRRADAARLLRDARARPRPVSLLRSWLMMLQTA